MFNNVFNIFIFIKFNNNKKKNTDCAIGSIHKDQTSQPGWLNTLTHLKKNMHLRGPGPSASPLFCHLKKFHMYLFFKRKIIKNK